MNARSSARGTRLIFRRGQGCRRQCYRPHPERGFCNGFRPLITRSISAPPVIANSEASLFTATLLSAVNKDRCGLGTIDCALHSLRPPQLPSLAAGLLWLRSLRLQTISVNCPTPPLAFSEPSMPVRSVSLSNRPCAILSATFSHPHRKLPPTFQALGTATLILHLRCKASTPGDGRCDAALTPLRQTANRLCQLRAFHGTEGSANSQTASGF